MIKKLFLLVMLFVGFSLNAGAGMSLLPGVSFTSAGDITTVAGAIAQMHTTAIRETAFDNLPSNDGRAADPTDNKSAPLVNVSWGQHQALSTQIAQLDQAIESVTSDKQRNRLSQRLDRLYQQQSNLIGASINQVTARLEAPPSNS